MQLARAKAGKQAFRQRHARRIVPDGLPVALVVFLRRDRLAKVVRERGKHEQKRILGPSAQGGRLPQHQHRVLKGVPLGVVHRVLRHAAQAI